MKFNFANWFIKKLGKWLQKETTVYGRGLSDFNRLCFEIKPADVLLFEGNHRISQIIRRVTFSPWTHAALYIGRLHDIEDEKLREKIQQCCPCSPSQQLIIESLLGQGTVVSPLEKYRKAHIRICRPAGLSHNDAQKVIAFCLERVGMKYSIRHIFDLFRFLFPWGIFPRRWRSTLFEHNAQKPTEEICSSLIAEAFNSVSFPILPLIKKEKQSFALIQRNPRLFTPSDFDYSPFFSIIKYPIFPLGEHFSYHDLPWTKNFISDDIAVVPIHLPEESKKEKPTPKE